MTNYINDELIHKFTNKKWLREKKKKGKKNKNIRNHSFIHYLIIGKFISLELYF